MVLLYWIRDSLFIKMMGRFLIFTAFSPFRWWEAFLGGIPVTLHWRYPHWRADAGAVLLHRQAANRVSAVVVLPLCCHLEAHLLSCRLTVRRHLLTSLNAVLIFHREPWLCCESELAASRSKLNCEMFKHLPVKIVHKHYTETNFLCVNSAKIGDFNWTFIEINTW